MKKTTSGFTIVELLIVIVVIAILAAISVVAYTGIQNRANDSSVQSDLRNIGQKIEMFRAEYGTWPVAGARMSNLGLKATKTAYGHHLGSGSNLVYCYNNSESSSGMGVAGASKSGKVFFYNGGVVREYTGAWQSGVTYLCPAISGGSPYEGRVWMLETGAWKPYI